MSREYGIVANVARTDSCLRMGAKVTLVDYGAGRVEVYGLSRGGRRIRKWVDIRALANYRAAWLREADRSTTMTRTKEDADQFAANLNVYGEPQPA